MTSVLRLLVTDIVTHTTASGSLRWHSNVILCSFDVCGALHRSPCSSAFHSSRLETPVAIFCKWSGSTLFRRMIFPGIGCDLVFQLSYSLGVPRYSTTGNKTDPGWQCTRYSLSTAYYCKISEQNSLSRMIISRLRSNVSSNVNEPIGRLPKALHKRPTHERYHCTETLHFVLLQAFIAC